MIVCILGLIAAIWWSVSRRSVGRLEISVNEEGDLAMTMEAFEKQE